MSGRDRDRRKGAAQRPAEKTPLTQSPAENTLLPPDKKKFEQNVSEISSLIRDLESQRKLLSSQGGQSSELNAELSKMSSVLTEIGQQKVKTTAEVRKVEEQVRKLGPDITSKKDDASKLLVALRYKSKERIEDAISKLQQQLLTRQYSANEERRLQTEIDTLEGSKTKLGEYLSTKTEIDRMREEQEQLREKRNSLYRASRELRGKEGEAKDQQEALRKRMDELRDKKKDLQSQKDTFTREIDTLFKARQKLRDDFRRAQADFLMAATQLSQRETEGESQRREEERKARRRRQVLEAEMQREFQYDEEKTTCRTLISHLQKHCEASTTNADSNGVGVMMNPRSSAATAVGLTSDSRLATSDRDVRESAQFKQPGEFLPRKSDDLSGYLVPTSSRKKSKRDKKRHTPSGKAPRPLQYDPMVLSQFAFLSVPPPTTHTHVAQVLHTLREKLVFYEHKSSACSEAGDSGIGSQALGDVSEQELNSQEEFDHTTLSPKRPSLDSLLSSDPLPHETNGLSPSPPTPDAKTLQHSLSSSTNTSNTSTTALVSPASDE